MRSNFALLSVLAFVASVNSAPVDNRLVPKAVPDVYRVAADPTRVDRRAAPAIEIEAVEIVPVDRRMAPALKNKIPDPVGVDV